MKTAIIATLTLLWVQHLHADIFADPEVAAVRQAHDTSIDGTKEEVEKTEELIRAKIAAHPDQPIYEVYLGSLLTIKSGKAFPGPSKLRYLKEGVLMMDAAVEKSGGDPAVRFVRAVNNYMLPTFVRRRDEARADFMILIGQLADPKVSEIFDEQTRQAICYFAGMSFKQEKERERAKEAWELGLAINRDSDLAKKISKELTKATKTGKS